LSYGTQEYKATVVLRFCREYDTGGEGPDSDVVFLDDVQLVAGGLPAELNELWADASSDADLIRAVLS